MRHGSGICFYSDGLVYKGSWFENQWGGPSGQGILRALNGEMQFGNFTGERGKLKDLSYA
jgi:hypothetical protein